MDIPKKFKSLKFKYSRRNFLLVRKKPIRRTKNSQPQPQQPQQPQPPQLQLLQNPKSLIKVEKKFPKFNSNFFKF